MTDIEAVTDISSSEISLEQLLTKLWEDVLETRVQPDDNFFALGGNSIKAVRVMNRLQEARQAIFHPATIFDAPTVRELADYCRKNYPDVFDSKRALSVSEETLSDEQMAQGRKHLLHRNTATDIRVDTTQPNNPSAVFILSPPRSGSTLLRVILGGHQALFSPPELYLLSFNTLQQRRDHFSGSRAFFREGLIRALMTLKGCTVTEAETIMADLEAQNMSARACFGLLQHWAGERCLVDKTPGYALNPEVLRRTEAEFHQAKFIHLVRHPMATINSFESIRADLVTGDPADSLPLTPRQKGELWWHVSHQNIRSFLQTIPADRQYQIKYEELVTSPQQIVPSLCDFLGITYCAQMLNPYQETQQRMTDGIRTESKILGDQKFHAFTGIDPGAAERWRDTYQEDFLCEASWSLAESFGYARESFGDTEREEWEI